MEWQYSSVILLQHLLEQIFVTTFMIASIELVTGEDVIGVRQALSPPVFARRHSIKDWAVQERSTQDGSRRKNS